MDSVPFNDLFRQYSSLKTEIDGAIESVIRRSAFVRGEFVEEFERGFSKLVGIDHCISCGNGTDAIYIALKALGVGPGDEIITTAHTWISTAETISQTGATVVFCDTEADSCLIDANDIIRKITNKTKCIIPVHLFGQAVDMQAVMSIAEKYGLYVVEDCAQAHLAEFNGQQVGTFGDIATFSFYPGKNLGAMGDAGAITTNNTELAEWMALYARHGGKGNHLIEGINSRMDGMQAAILNVKMTHLQKWTSVRIKIAQQYDDLFSECDSVKTPFVHNGRKHVYHLYVVQVDNRHHVKNELAKRGISTVVNYPIALPNCAAYENRGYKLSDFPNATKNQERILSLPIFPEMDDSEIRYVADSLISVIKTI
jgi:dTDP-4-amino-4,6-dideoxygalactose transaminase